MLRQRFTQVDPQAGFVSLFSTLFFMILITVITIGFIKIMSTEQQQALNNDLSASALASAQSGLEDGKRILHKYFGLPAGQQKTDYYNAMTLPQSSTCNAIVDSRITTDLGLDPTRQGNIVNNAQIKQSYSCLSINLNSPDYISQSSAGKSQLVPLKAVGNDFQQIKISWHMLSAAVGEDGDGVPERYSPTDALNPLINSGNPPASWQQLGYPAYLRVQLYGYPTNSPNFGRAHLEARSRSALLAPGTIGYAANAPINLGTADPNPGVLGQAELRPTMVRCNPNFADETALGTYACTALLELPAGASYVSTNNSYFLRVTPTYGQTHFRIALVRGGSELTLDQVQPIVDVTGKAGQGTEVYRRLQARMVINSQTNFPEFVVESGNTICKNLQVSNNAADYRANNCP